VPHTAAVHASGGDLAGSRSNAHTTPPPPHSLQPADCSAPGRGAEIVDGAESCGLAKKLYAKRMRSQLCPARRPTCTQPGADRAFATHLWCHQTAPDGVVPRLARASRLRLPSRAAAAPAPLACWAPACSTGPLAAQACCSSPRSCPGTALQPSAAPRSTAGGPAACRAARRPRQHPPRAAPARASSSSRSLRKCASCWARSGATRARASSWTSSLSSTT
jgi:hypothetical protein